MGRPEMVIWREILAAQPRGYLEIISGTVREIRYEWHKNLYRLVVE